MFRQMSKPDFDKAKLFLQNKIEDVGQAGIAKFCAKVHDQNSLPHVFSRPNIHCLQIINEDCCRKMCLLDLMLLYHSKIHNSNGILTNLPKTLKP